MKRLIQTRTEIHNAASGQVLELHSSPKWACYLRISDEGIKVRALRSAHDFRWHEIAWVGLDAPVGLSKGDKVYLTISVIVAALLRDTPLLPVTTRRSAMLRIAPKGSPTATPGPSNPHRFALVGADEQVSATVESFLRDSSRWLGVEFRPANPDMPP
jgi:hypothetical protein